eukprot:SAG31_NODE_33613_length_342_cov_0.341564_1_plen_59_part_10
MRTTCWLAWTEPFSEVLLAVCIIPPEVPSSLRSHGAAIIAIAENFGGRGELGARARRMK